MGVGDRHSKRVAAEKAKAQSASQRAREIADRELDDHPDTLVDPVAMRDIGISRARTVDDPLTTRVLAEIARSEGASEASSEAPAARGPRGPLPQRARTRDAAVKIAPPRILSASAAATDAPSRARTPARSPDTRTVEAPDPASPHTQPRASEESVAPSRSTTRRGIGAPEILRKK